MLARPCGAYEKFATGSRSKFDDPPTSSLARAGSSETVLNCGELMVMARKVLAGILESGILFHCWRPSNDQVCQNALREELELQDIHVHRIT